MTRVFQEMDGTSDDEDEDQRISNGDLSRDLRQDDDDLRDPVDVRMSFSSRITFLTNIILYRSVRPLLRRTSGYRVSSEVSRRTSPTPEMTRWDHFVASRHKYDLS